MYVYRYVVNYVYLVSKQTVMTFSIRPLINADADSVVQLILPIQREEFGVNITLEDQPDLLDVEGYYKASGGEFWGAFAEGELVGTIALIFIGHAGGAIRKMFVRKENRGRQLGIAQQLMDTLIEYCSQHGIENIYLGSVEAMKAAHRFYERNGFQRVQRNEIPGYFPFMKPDNVFYEHTINKTA